MDKETHQQLQGMYNELIDLLHNQPMGIIQAACSTMLQATCLQADDPVDAFDQMIYCIQSQKQRYINDPTKYNMEGKNV